MRFARTPPGRNYNRWKRCPEQSCQVFGKWLSGPRNSAQLGSTSRSSNRNHIFESSPGCLRLCSKILSSSLARSRSILCGRPPLTPLNSTLCMTKKKGEEKKEKREKKGKKNVLRSTGKEKGEKTTKPDEPIGLFTKRKIRFFSSFLSDRDTAKRFFLPLVSQKLFFFSPRSLDWNRVIDACTYMHASLFLYENVSKNSIVHFDNFFFFFFIRSIRISDFLKVMIMIIVNSPPRRSLLPSLDLILHLEKKGKSSEILTRSFKLRIFNFLSWEGNGVERKFLSTVFIYDDNISR